MPGREAFYDEFYARVERSRAHAAFCERVYGLNLAQHGMADLAQLEQLLAAVPLGPETRVLELGCGNGRITEYLSDRTGACFTGIDLSGVGIAQAQVRTAGRRARLAFVQADIATYDFSRAAYDVVLSIDSIQFLPDLAGALTRLRGALRPGGRMALFYSTWAAAGVSPEQLRPQGTAMAEALRAAGLAYSTSDLTAQEIAHWNRKLEAAHALRAAFEAEGNAFLYENRACEAETHQQYVQAGRVARYLYLAQTDAL